MFVFFFIYVFVDCIDVVKSTGKSSMLLKHIALLFDGLVQVGVTSVPARDVQDLLKVAKAPSDRNLLLSKSREGLRMILGGH
jgi:hypothetical protein